MRETIAALLLVAAATSTAPVLSVLLILPVLPLLGNCGRRCY